MPKQSIELNIPKEFSRASLNETAKELLQKSNAYRQLFGDEFVSQGFQQLGPQFFTLLDAELSRNPTFMAIQQSSHRNNPNTPVTRLGLGQGSAQKQTCKRRVFLF